MDYTVVPSHPFHPHPAGQIPLDPRLATCLEEGRSFIDVYTGTPAQTAMAQIVQKILLRTESETDRHNTETTEQSS